MITVINSTITYAEKLEKLEKELLKLKKGSKQSLSAPISLKGIWKGVQVSEADIGKAKKSLFRSRR
ncbi:MAG: hypothetical protein A3J54_01930 [Candidatus Ryanbacteria bacterium RIFCSPHIGHO2_02_FULL_45_13b]|uniref:Uncharacterized protein n=1 Tax=Candidatus Ryanbacteria bacterium RIFCSPHIGHO2_02_FULL_45_13b TaxID=1802117 RepID=A0A1G2G9M2_9BACT|nr:MAG: hypothetical protein A3J54_01930 [Candidatus Ryanbacteria bacterium RIFCSPHIGHO2_02_FULL_45_13b]